MRRTKRRPKPYALIPPTVAPSIAAATLSFVSRQRSPLRVVVTRDFSDAEVACAVVDLRRDSANTCRLRRVNDVAARPKLRRVRPRYLNVLVRGFPNRRDTAAALDGIHLDLFESSPSCVVGVVLARDLAFTVESGCVLRVRVDCIDPQHWPRSTDAWLALRCRDRDDCTVHLLHFVVSWWKADRTRRSGR